MIINRTSRKGLQLLRKSCDNDDDDDDGVVVEMIVTI